MTEKNYNPKQKEKKAMKKQSIVQTPKKQAKIDVKNAKEKESSKTKPKEPTTKEKQEVPKTEKKESIEKVKEKKTEVKNETKETKPKEVPKVKKSEAVVNGRSIQISTKYSTEICRFIKNKSIENAIKDLEQVLAHKKAIPMKGEYGHKKGKRMAGGKYPKKATEHFIKLLKSLSANAAANSIEEPVIVEAISNMAARPMGRFGRWQRKRTHIKIVAKQKKLKIKKKKEGKK